MNKLYIGNLPFSTDEDKLKDLFSEKGMVNSVAIIKDRETNRSKGFGFVEMSTGDEATAVIEAFNNVELDGRNLRVSIAKPKTF